MELKVGQVWKFDNNMVEKSFLTVVKIENRKNIDIVHISIDGFASHLPVQKDFVEKSVVELISYNNSLPDFEEGYNMWNSEFEKGKAGVFKMTIKEIVDFLTDMMRQK